MFKKVKMSQEAPFKGNSGELGLFRNGGAGRNGRGLSVKWAVSIPLTDMHYIYNIYIIYIDNIYIYIYIYIYIIHTYIMHTYIIQIYIYVYIYIYINKDKKTRK